MSQLLVQNFYSTTVTEASGIAASGDVNFTVAIPPTQTNGFIVISPDNINLREIMYYHDVIGNRIYVRGVNRISPKAHTVSESVKINDVAEIFNFFSNQLSQAFYVEKTGGLAVKVWGGWVFYNAAPQQITDTAITLTDNATNYITYTYSTNTIAASLTDTGNVKAVVTTVSGSITGITYRVPKESYLDYTITITGALPSQSGNAGKALLTDGTNVSWQDILTPAEAQNESYNYGGVSTGAANVYAITLSPAPSAYAVGQRFTFKSHQANAGACTLNVNGLGAKDIVKFGSTALTAGDILNTGMISVMYDGTNFQLTSSLSNATAYTMSTAKVLGRTTAGSGAVEEISIGSGLSMTAGVLSATPSNISVRAIQNATQAITDNNPTAIAFQSELFDTDVMHDNSTNNTRLTIKTDGDFIFGGTVFFPSNGDVGVAQLIQVRLNGSTILASNYSTAASSIYMSISTMYNLAINDYIEIIVTGQFSASPNNTSGDAQTNFWAKKI